MPADRTKSRGRSSPQSSEIEFTTALTPKTYPTAPGSPPPTRSSLQPTYLFPIEDDTHPAPKPSTRKGPDHIPRPPNAFILFRSAFIKRQHVSSTIETSHSTLSKIIGMTWRALPRVEKEVWFEKAREAREAHKRRWPGYAFKPVTGVQKEQQRGQKKGKESRSRPGEVLRCEKIAELLCSGKRGEELNAAVRDFDREQPVREGVEVRFEEPVTACAFSLPEAEGLDKRDPETRMEMGERPQPAQLAHFDAMYAVGESADAFTHQYEPGFIDFSAYDATAQTQPSWDFEPMFGTLEFDLSAYGGPETLSGYVNQWGGAYSATGSSSEGSYATSSPSTSFGDVYAGVESVDSGATMTVGYCSEYLHVPDVSTYDSYAL